MFWSILLLWAVQLSVFCKDVKAVYLSYEGMRSHLINACRLCAVSKYAMLI